MGPENKIYLFAIVIDFRLTGAASVVHTIFAVSPRVLYNVEGD